MNDKRTIREQEDAWRRDLSGKSVGEFKLIEFIGAGKVGYVYRAEHQNLAGHSRAVKLTFDLREGWEVELHKVMKLEQVDGVVHFHELDSKTISHEGTSKMCQFTVWDYIEPGENLATYLQRERTIPTSFVLAVIERILHVLHACIAVGVHRHGDLHSGNILIGRDGSHRLDDALQPRDPIYVSDFGYGATGAAKAPKDDYVGLAAIINAMIVHVDYATATSTHRQILQGIQRNFGKLLHDTNLQSRLSPLDLLKVLREIKSSAQAGESSTHVDELTHHALDEVSQNQTPTVGQFQVSEMIGDHWGWWQRLFVPTVPARSKILALDIPTVVTGPRGCGKTMLFRRLSERLVVECGEVQDSMARGRFVAFYVNANDFADAFAHFPENPTAAQEAHLICYANLCVLADLLAVESARVGRNELRPTNALLSFVQSLLLSDSSANLIEGEDRLERYRAVLEQIKWKFPWEDAGSSFLGYAQMAQHRWLPHFMNEVRTHCPWVRARAILLFVDDYSTPRVSNAMQRVLNRLFLQRSQFFLAKIATEASSTFLPEDSSGKNLQDGDDFQLVDMGEEALFLPDDERLAFLNDVFLRRLELDPRVPRGDPSLFSLLGRSGLSKTEFARQLRVPRNSQAVPETSLAIGSSQRRGRSAPRILYFGEDIFSNMWSGDTRTMIQLITDVVDQAVDADGQTTTPSNIVLPVDPLLQDRVFRNRGGEWLNSHTRNEPTNPQRMREELALLQQLEPTFKLCGAYGDHLKAVVEAFVAAATQLLHGPTYKMRSGMHVREVPRMAFRLEIVDEFRIEGLAREIYRDLIRYGLFMRDNRGKSVRGTFVPRLYLRRLLLPYCTLAMSKRDSVQLTCKTFVQLLLAPDDFKAALVDTRPNATNSPDQFLLPFDDAASSSEPDPDYDDTKNDIDQSKSGFIDPDPETRQ